MSSEGILLPVFSTNVALQSELTKIPKTFTTLLKRVAEDKATQNSNLQMITYLFRVESSFSFGDIH